MASPLDSAVRKQVAAAFRGRLLRCTLRRATASSQNAYGDVVPGTPVDYPFDGIVDTFSAFFASAAGIPATDVRVLIIAGSLAVEPVVDDKVRVRSDWYQLRRLVERDPANATYIFSGFKVSAS